MTLILAQKGRKLARDVSIEDADGATITVVEADIVQLKIGRSGKASLLSVSSDAVTANGSQIELNHTPGTHRVSIAAADMDLLEPGVYSFELALVDSADGDAVKHVDYQVMVVQATQLGETS
jgi:hypothetical protein